MLKPLVFTGLAFCFAGGLMLISAKSVVAEYADCKVGLDALSTCVNVNTGNCPSSCKSTNTATNGQEWSNATVYTHISGSSAADSSVNVDCWRNVTCSSSYDGLKVCDPFSGKCLNGSNGYGCWTFSKSFGNWVPASSSRIKPCPN